jgi:hypothetical protein
LTGADVFSSPQVGDIDGDEDYEVIVGSDDTKVYAWHADGTPVEGWPKQTTLSIKGSPALADLDDDLEQEVVVGDFGGSLYVWNYSGVQQLYLPVLIK